MASAPLDVASEVSLAVDDYRRRGDTGALVAALAALAERAEPSELAAAAAPYSDVPEVVAPIYERIVARGAGSAAADAQAAVVLANAYWLPGRGPEAVGALASRAISVDPANRGAWHLWALSEPDLSSRVERWRHVAQRFPADELALALLADNAASLAGAEQDPLALALAIETYERLRAAARLPEQRAALERALETLRAWKL